MRGDQLEALVAIWPDLRPFVAAGLIVTLDLGAGLTALQGRLFYLATPYTERARGEDGQWDGGKSLEAREDATLWHAKLAARGVLALPPVVLGDELVRECPPYAPDPMDGAAWAALYLPLLRKCDGLVLPPIYGWGESAGIKAEIDEMLRLNRRVYVIAA